MATYKHWGRRLPQAHDSIITRCTRAERLDREIQEVQAKLYDLQCRRGEVEHAITKDAEAHYPKEIIAQALSPTESDYEHLFE
jgi:hypothetical protein